jgi:hypothetical protein
VQAADQVFSAYRTVGHQSATVRTTPVQNAYSVIESDDNKINVGNECIRRLAILQFVPVTDCNFVHFDALIEFGSEKFVSDDPEGLGQGGVD